MRGRIHLGVVLFLALAPQAAGQDSTGVLNAAVPWDAPLTLRVNRIESPCVTGVSLVLSDMLTPTAIALPPTLLLAGHIRERNSPGSGGAMAEAGVRVGLSALTAHGIVQILKPLFGRDRPFTRPDLGFIARVEEHGPSFPSGHATVSAAIATSLSLSEPRAWIIVPSLLWSAGTAFSRMHLGVHYFGDVVAGIVLGIAIGALWHGLRDRVNAATEGILPRPQTAVSAPRPEALFTFVVPFPGGP